MTRRTCGSRTPLSLAKLYSADFIVYNGTPGCRNTWGMVKLFARDTEKAGFPTYIMYADAFDDRVESWEATQDRFEEFLTVRRLCMMVAGCDVGSLTSKAVIMKDGKILNRSS